MRGGSSLGFMWSKYRPTRVKAGSTVKEAVVVLKPTWIYYEAEKTEAEIFIIKYGHLNNFLKLVDFLGSSPNPQIKYVIIYNKVSAFTSIF